MSGALPFRLLHPDLALERACDMGNGHCTHDHPRTMKIIVPAQPVPSEAERAEGTYRRAWWQAHYWGQPSRSEEHGLAIIRAVTRLPEAEAVTYMARKLRP